ncbi:MAG: Spy/CpxP family protein refolding chaperone [Curvibacter sp.]|nr:Spy/CpxP family protein refolding chaperone [Curvibacter sp.]
MLKTPRHLLLAGLLAATGLVAQAQTATPAAAPATPAPMAQGHEHHGPSPARMQAMFAKHLEKLKAKLKITPEQEGAWSTFTDAIKPPSNPPAHPDHAEWAKLTTPERIDRMQAMHSARAAEMSKRADATKTFYAALNADQQKVFDAESLRMMSHHFHKGMGHEHHE